MGDLFGSDEQTSTNTSESKPWAPAIPILENLLNQADKLFNEQGGINADFIEKELAGLTPEMKEVVNNMINSTGFKDLATNLGNAAQQGLGGIGQSNAGLGAMAGGQLGITTDQLNEMAEGMYNSDLVKSQTDQLTKNVQEGLAGEMQAINQRAASSGGMGSSRAGVAEGVATGKAADAIASGSASIQNSAMQDAMNKALAIAQGNQGVQVGGITGLGNLGIQSGQLQAGLAGILDKIQGNQLTGAGILQNWEQQYLNNKWFNQMGQQQMGWDQLNKLLGIAGGIGGMGGTSTSTGTASGGGGGGALGGLMSGVGGIMGGLGAMGFSDARLKDNVTTVFEAGSVSQEGNVYQMPRLVKWDWNDTAKALFAEKCITDEAQYPVSYGVIAQELEELGYDKFVEYMDTEVEALGDKVRAVNYAALAEFARIIGAIE